MTHRPLLIYVSGAPGAGKTTLAKRKLYIPHISSDLVHGGVRLAEHGPIDRKKSLHEIFVPLLITMAKTHISFVVDHVLQKNMSEKAIIDKVRPHADIVYIHVRANNPIERFYRRELARTDRGIVLDSKELQLRRDFRQSNLANTIHPLRFEVPTLEVDTTEGYVPRLERILDFIDEAYNKEGK